MRSRLSRGIAIAALALGISIVAFAGISLAASGGNGTTGQIAQTPLGEQSAPGSTNNGGVENEVVSGNQTPTSPGSGNAPVTVTNNTSSGSNTKSLPFTGLLVIPVLLAGLALLGTGLVLRRRELTVRF